MSRPVRSPRRGPIVTRNDALLWLVPVPVVLGAAIAALVGVASVFGAGLGSAVAGALLAYGLFVEYPVPPAAVGRATGITDRRYSYPDYPPARLETRGRVDGSLGEYPATCLESLARR